MAAVFSQSRRRKNRKPPPRQAVGDELVRRERQPVKHCKRRHRTSENQHTEEESPTNDSKRGNVFT